MWFPPRLTACLGTRKYAASEHQVSVLCCLTFKVSGLTLWMFCRSSAYFPYHLCIFLHLLHGEVSQSAVDHDIKVHSLMEEQGPESIFLHESQCIAPLKVCGCQMPVVLLWRPLLPLHNYQGAHSGRSRVGVQGLLLTQGFAWCCIVASNPEREHVHEDVDLSSGRLPDQLKFLSARQGTWQVSETGFYLYFSVIIRSLSLDCWDQSTQCLVPETPAGECVSLALGWILVV